MLYVVINIVIILISTIIFLGLFQLLRKIGKRIGKRVGIYVSNLKDTTSPEEDEAQLEALRLWSIKQEEKRVKRRNRVHN